MAQVAKVVTNGRSQAIRLPPEYRFKSKEVYIRKNEDTGEVILSEKTESKPKSWDKFFELIKDLDVPEDFLSRDNDPKETRGDPFEGWVE